MKDSKRQVNISSSKANKVADKEIGTIGAIPTYPTTIHMMTRSNTKTSRIAPARVMGNIGIDTINEEKDQLQEWLV